MEIPLTPPAVATPSGVNSTGLPALSIRADPLEIRPGDSSAVVDAKIRAFTLNVLLEVLAELPLDLPTKDQLSELLKNGTQTRVSRATKIEPDLIAVDPSDAQSTERSHGTAHSGSTHSRSQPHDLSKLTSDGGIVSRLFTPTTEADLRSLVREVIKQGNVREELKALVVATLASKDLEILASEQAFIGLQNNLALRGAEVSQKVLNGLLLRVLQAGDAPESSNGSAPRFGATQLTPLQWKLVAVLQERINETIFNGADLSPEYREVPSVPKSARSDLQLQSPARDAIQQRPIRADLDELRSLFFENSGFTGPSSRPADAALERELTNVLTALTQRTASSPNIVQQITAPALNTAALNNLVALLASRIVSAHRLAPDSGRAQNTNKRRYQNVALGHERAWELNFSASESVQEECSVRVTSRAGRSEIFAQINTGSDRNRSANIAARAKIFSEAFGFNWLQWSYYS